MEKGAEERKEVIVPKCGGASAKFPAREEVVRGEIFTAGTGTRSRKRKDAETEHSQTEVFIAKAELVASRDRPKPQWRPRLPEAKEMRGRDAVTADRGEEGIIRSIAKNSLKTMRCRAFEEEREEVSSRRERRTRSKKRQRLMNIEEKRVRRGESERRRNAGNRGQKGRRSDVSQST